MLKNIKSDFFIRKMFSLIYKPNLIKLVKYNKNYQKLSELNIIDYRLISGRYIIYKENNKAEEYDSYNDEMIYEGGYSKGKRNGQGREYEKYLNYFKKSFEGEYLNGKRNGKGKEYFNNKLIFEGEYLNDKKWTGKGYNYDEVSYKLIDGKGFVKEYYSYAGSNSVLKYEGEFSNGERNGKGKEYYYEGNLKFEGEYLKY